MSRAVTRRISGLFVLMGWLGFTNPAAAEVLIVKSRSLGAYDLAVEGILAEVKQEAQVVDLGDWRVDRESLLTILRQDLPPVTIAVGREAAIFVRSQFPDMPMVYCMVADAAEIGILEDGSTGVQYHVPATAQFTMLRTVMPKVTTIGTLYNPFFKSEEVSEAQDVAKDMDLDFEKIRVRDRFEVAEALERILKRDIDVLWLTSDSTVLAQGAFDEILTACTAQGIPLMAQHPGQVGRGALLSLSPRYESLGAQAGRLANRILEGEVSADIAPEAPQDHTLAINLDVVRDLDLEVPPSVVDLADIVVQRPSASK